MKNQQNIEHIRILTSENFMHWSRLTESILKAKSLSKYITADTNQEDDQAGAAYYVIASSLDEKMFAQFQTHTTPYALWNAIKNTLGTFGNNEGIIYETQLKECHMIDNDPIGFINHLEELFTKCYLVNRPVSEQQKLDYLLKGLRGQYAMICLLFVNAKDEERTFSAGKRAIDFIRPYLNTSESFKKFDKKCTNCGKFGHSTSNCRNTSEGINFTSYEEYAFSDIHASIKNAWILDSGASRHYTNNPNCFIKDTFHHQLANVNASGNVLNSIGFGDVVLNLTNTEGLTKKIILKDVMLVPKLPTNLISEAKLTENNIGISKTNDNCFLHLQEVNSSIKVKKDKSLNLYILNVIQNSQHDETKYKSPKTILNIMDAHRALGHVNVVQLRKK